MVFIAINGKLCIGDDDDDDDNDEEDEVSSFLGMTIPYRGVYHVTHARGLRSMAAAVASTLLGLDLKF